MILIKNEQAYPIDLDKLKRDAKIILQALDYADFDVGLLLATPDAIQEYNKTYRDKDKATDIVSFPYHDVIAGERVQASSDDDKNLGDVIMCPQFVADDLARWNMTFQERMEVLLVHGICHLLGYDHIKDEDYAVMKLKEEALLEKIRAN